ncbi:hypothetical protein, partial [Mesorhizobium sp. M1A.F.Ca.IN.020.06.1.1]|uniref:hypothetical protein n=1 Tax=Mesorhizobium sp. M1A.F.Ca.IN.020.06.1.1 TaxID=2496765 RepID=UPI0019D4C12C
LQRSGRDCSCRLGLSRHTAFPLIGADCLFPIYVPGAITPDLPAFFHHERIRRLKSSAISAILIEWTFKMK